MLKIKRAYDPKKASDGERILIDGLWPRGVSKAEAGIDVWMKDLAPSTELRKWFGHDPEKWAKFKARYIQELSSPEKMKLLKTFARRATGDAITLIYGAKDTDHSNVKVLEELIRHLMEKA